MRFESLFDLEHFSTCFVTSLRAFAKLKAGDVHG